MSSQLRCTRGHALIRFEMMECDAGHEHRLYVCPMRRGRGVCGELVVVLPMGASCIKRADDD